MGTGFLHVLGGTLQGVGAGMAKQAEMDWTQRRELALQKMRGEQDLAEQTQRGQDALTLADRQHTNALDLQTNKGVVDVEVERRKAPIRQQVYAANKEADTEAEIKVLGVKAENDKVLTRLKSTLDRSNDAASQKLRDELEGDNVDQVFTSENGNWHILTKNGETKDTGIKATERELAGARSTTTASLVEQMRAERAARGGTGSAPAPAATSAAPGPPRRRDGQDNTKVYTAADAQATARKHGITVDEVHSRMRAAGYKLTN